MESDIRSLTRGSSTGLYRGVSARKEKSSSKHSRCIMMVEFLSEYRCPFSPPANNRLPILAAEPIQNVCTGVLIYCIVSYIARPAVTTPPGELMYSLIGRDESSASRNRSCAVRRVEVWSWTWNCHEFSKLGEGRVPSFGILRIAWKPELEGFTHWSKEDDPFL